MRQTLEVTVYISDEGWIYADSFGCAELIGRDGQNVGIREKNGVRTLHIPKKVDGLEVYLLSFHGFMKDFEALYIPDGVGFILPGAFAGCENLKKVRIPSSMLEIADNAFYGTAIPEKRLKQLYAIKYDCAFPVQDSEIPPQVYDSSQALPF